MNHNRSYEFVNSPKNDNSVIICFLFIYELFKVTVEVVWTVNGADKSVISS